MVIGLGVTLDDGSSSPGRLQEVGIKVQRLLRWRHLYLLRHALCAGVPGVGEDSCRVDSAVPFSVGKAQVVRTGLMRRFASWVE
jgi:hypothetical protein